MTVVLQLLLVVLLVGGVSGLLSPQPQTAIVDLQSELSPQPQTAIHVVDLQSELNAQGLGLCHGVLHACGVRSIADLKSLTPAQIESMGTDAFDRRALLQLISEMPDKMAPAMKLSTSVDGAFDRPRGRFDPEVQENFDFKLIETDIFVGKLFTVEQCEQMNRMAEYHSYRGIGTIGAGWTNEMYTLTAQHLQCKEIPGFLSTTRPIFEQLLRALYELYPGRIKPGSICYESDGEPHLVKYNGKAKGTQLHTDNSEFVYITVNALLSDPTDYTGGGTYITKLDRTIQLEQGEMLIHLGDLEHAGMEITSGVRRILIAFLACQWEEEELNIEKVENAR
jgi:hypothetical protein